MIIPLPFEHIEIFGNVASYRFIDRNVDLDYFRTLDSETTYDDVEKVVGKPNGIIFSTGALYYETNGMYVVVYYFINDDGIYENIRSITLWTNKDIVENIYNSYYDQFEDVFWANKGIMEDITIEIKNENVFCENDSLLSLGSGKYSDSEEKLVIYYEDGKFVSSNKTKELEILNSNIFLLEKLNDVINLELVHRIDIECDDGIEIRFNIEDQYTEFITINNDNNNAFIYSEKDDAKKYYHPIKENWYMYVQPETE